MKKFTPLIAAAVLALAGCGGASAGDVEATGGTGSVAASLPAPAANVTRDCSVAMKASASQGSSAWHATTGECADVADWVAGVHANPDAVPGYGEGVFDPEDLSVDDLSKACLKRDSAPVCADAIGQGLIDSTGDDYALIGLAEPAAVCGVSSAVADEGVSLTMETSGKKSVGEHSWSDVECILDELETPQYVREHINTTRGLDGQQEDEWGDYRARWTYHGNQGLHITFIWQG